MILIVFKNLFHTQLQFTSTISKSIQILNTNDLLYESVRVAVTAIHPPALIRHTDL